MLTNPVYPRSVGVCPVCNGSKLVYSESLKKGIPCTNCGGQYMSGTPTGLVPHNLEHDRPCTHEYKATRREKCYAEFQCIHCGDRYSWDSSD